MIRFEFVTICNISLPSVGIQENLFVARSGDDFFSFTLLTYQSLRFVSQLLLNVGAACAVSAMWGGVVPIVIAMVCYCSFSHL